MLRSLPAGQPEKSPTVATIQNAWSTVHRKTHHMSFDRFVEPIRSAEELEQIIGTPSGISLKKELKTLDGHMRRFIEHSPFVVLSTHSADGRCDASPRGDAPGFVCVVDDTTLLIPDRLGNKRVDTYRNILETGRIGLLFLVPGVGETLRVNGRAAIIRDEAWMAKLAARGKQPQVAVAVTVEECFLQCAKALLRSNLWEPHARPDPQSLPCAARMLADHVRMPEYDEAQMQSLLDTAYRDRLY
jgi:uncharacterized protein